MLFYLVDLVFSRLHSANIPFRKVTFHLIPSFKLISQTEKIFGLVLDLSMTRFSYIYLYIETSQGFCYCKSKD